MFLSPFYRTQEEWADIRAIFQGLMLEMENRGGDGCGFAVVKDDGTVTSHLRLPLVTVHEAIVMKAWREALATIGPGTRAVIGHTRLATTGNTKDEHNFHPFLSGNVLGAHNGMVYNHLEVADKLGLLERLEGDCDSEVIFASMNLLAGNRYLDQKQIDLALDCFDAAYALTVMDVRNPDRMFLLRGDNPLYVNYDKRLDMRAWASTTEAFITGYSLANLRRTAELQPPVNYYKAQLVSTLTGWDIHCKTLYTQEEFALPWHGLSSNTYNGWVRYGTRHYSYSNSNLRDEELNQLSEYYSKQEQLDGEFVYGYPPVTKPITSVKGTRRA